MYIPPAELAILVLVLRTLGAFFLPQKALAMFAGQTPLSKCWRIQLGQCIVDLSILAQSVTLSMEFKLYLTF